MIELDTTKRSAQASADNAGRGLTHLLEKQQGGLVQFYHSGLDSPKATTTAYVLPAAYLLPDRWPLFCKQDEQEVYRDNSGESPSRCSPCRTPMAWTS